MPPPENFLDDQRNEWGLAAIGEFAEEAPPHQYNEILLGPQLWYQRKGKHHPQNSYGLQLFVVQTIQNNPNYGSDGPKYGSKVEIRWPGLGGGFFFRRALKLTNPNLYLGLEIGGGVTYFRTALLIAQQIHRVQFYCAPGHNVVWPWYDETSLPIGASFSVSDNFHFNMELGLERQNPQRFWEYEKPYPSFYGSLGFSQYW